MPGRHSHATGEGGLVGEMAGVVLPTRGDESAAMELWRGLERWGRSLQPGRAEMQRIRAHTSARASLIMARVEVDFNNQTAALMVERSAHFTTVQAIRLAATSPSAVE